MVIKLTEKQKIRVMNSDDLYEVMRQILLRENKIDQDQEHFWVVCLNGLNKIINIELVGLGSVDTTIVKPMQIFRIAIQKGAVKVILVHNHPSGGLIPTHADRDLTDRMVQVGKIIHIEVCDHLIITLDGFYAFSKKGLLEEIRGSKKFVPLYKEQERIRKEALKIGKLEGLREGKKLGMEKGAKGKALEMAKKMKQKGESIKKIVEYTGLSKEEIEKL